MIHLLHLPATLLLHCLLLLQGTSLQNQQKKERLLRQRRNGTKTRGGPVGENKPQVYLDLHLLLHQLWLFEDTKPITMVLKVILKVIIKGMRVMVEDHLLKM